MSGLLIHRISFIFHADAPDVPTNTHRSVASPSRARRGQLDPPAPFVRLPIPAQRTTGSSNAKEGDAIGICQGDGYNHDHERHQEPQTAASPDAARRARGMTAAPWFVRTKLLLYAALGFLLGVAVTVSFMGSTPYTTSTVAMLRGGALGLFFPPAAATTNLSPAGVLQASPPQQSGPIPGTIRSRQSWPPADTGGIAPADAPPPPTATSVVQVQSPARGRPPQPQQAAPTQSTITSHRSHPAADTGINSATSLSPLAPAGIKESEPTRTGVSHNSVSFSVIDDEELLARAGPAVGVAVGEVLRRPRRALLRLRAHRPGVQRYGAAGWLRLLPAKDPHLPTH
jgi:hypothetical protein